MFGILLLACHLHKKGKNSFQPYSSKKSLLGSKVERKISKKSLEILAAKNAPLTVAETRQTTSKKNRKKRQPKAAGKNGNKKQKH